MILIVMEQIKYNGAIIKVTEEMIDGHKWERVYLKNGVLVLPFDSSGNLYLIHELRPHETPKSRWKLVTGCIDKDLPLEEIAQIELQEELGMKAGTLKKYMETKEMATVRHTRTYFIATGLSPSKKPNEDTTTVLGTKTLPFRSVYEMALK